MASVIGYAKYIWAAWKAWAVKHAVAAFIIKTVVSVAVSTAIGRALAPKLGGGALTSGSPLQMTRDPAPPRSVIYGEIRKSGPLLDYFVSGTKNEYLGLVVGLAGHECESITTVFFNDEAQALDGVGNVLGTLNGFAKIKKKLGATGQAAEADYVADSAGQRSASDFFDRVAYLYALFTWDDKKWPSSFPNLSAIVKGRKCYDPRSGLTVWTDNPALCVRDYLTNAEFGLAVDASEVDDPSFIVAANICDELVALAAGGTEKRYRCNGTFETTAEPASVLEKLVESMSGAVVYIGGKWVCYAGAHATPEASHLTEDDLSAPISVQTRLSLRDTCNRVRGTFSSPDDGWQPADVVPIVNAMYLAEDGGIEIWRDISLAFVTSHSQAQRIFKIELERTRQGITATLPCKLTALRYKPGDVVPIDNAELGWVGKLFLVTGMKFSTYTGDGQLALGVDLSVRETAAEVWDWNNGEETTYDPAPNTSLIDTRLVPVPAGFAATVATLTEKTALPRVKLTWNLPQDQFVLAGGFTETEYKKAADAVWLPWAKVPGNINLDYVTDLQVATTTEFRARHINRAGVPGNYCAPVSAVPQAGDASYTVNLTNDRHGVACDAGGTPLAGELGVGSNAFCDAQCWAGNAPLAAVPAAPALGQFSISAAVVAGVATFTKTANDRIRCDSMGSQSVTIRVTFNLEGLTTRDMDFILWKINSGSPLPRLLCTAAAVNRDNAGVFTPPSVTFSAQIRSGGGAPAPYNGRLKIDVDTGSGWVNVYNSPADESSKVYAPPAGTIIFRCQLYEAGAFSVFLDEEEIPITDDGNPGAPGAPGSPGASGATILAEGGGGGVVNGTSPNAIPTCILVTTAPAGDRLATFTGSVSNAGPNTNYLNIQLQVGGSGIGETFSFPDVPPGQSRAFTIIGTFTGTGAGVSLQGYAWGGTGGAGYDVAGGGSIILQ